MIFLGIDLSLTNTGCVKLKNGKIIEEQSIKSKPLGDTPKLELKRIQSIIKDIDIERTDFVALEGLAFMVHNTTSLVQLAGLNYLLRSWLQSLDIPFIVVQPTMLKKFVTGKGNCGKDIMLLETYKRYGISFEDNNLCDAHGLARIAESLNDKKGKYIIFQKEVIDKLKKQL